MRLWIRPCWSLLEGDLIKKVSDELSFKNKSVGYQLFRAKQYWEKRERNLIEKYQGSDELDEALDHLLEIKKNAIQKLSDQYLVRACREVTSVGASKDALLVPTGLVPRLKNCVESLGEPLDITDERRFEGPRISLPTPAVQFRKPQLELLERVMKNKTKLKGIGTFELATGTGKTVCAAALISELGLKAIFLVPKKDLLNQTVEKFREFFGKDHVGIFGAGKRKPAHVTVATYQSVTLADPNLFQDVQLLIADEVHHIAAKTFFSSVCERITNAVYRIGLTADSVRADGGTLLVEAGVGPVEYSYSAREGIRDGYLATPTFVIYEVYQTKGHWVKEYTSGRTKTIETEHYNAQDHLVAYKNWVLGNDLLNAKIAEIANAFAKSGKSVCILVDEKQHGKKLKSLLPSSEFAVGGLAAVDGMIRRFNRRELKVFIGTSVLGEGTDLIPVDVLIELQGGASVSTTKQADGRALRNEEQWENGVRRVLKPKTLIIDFDFPNCRILSKHSKSREKVHSKIGQIHRFRLI